MFLLVIELAVAIVHNNCHYVQHMIPIPGLAFDHNYAAKQEVAPSDVKCMPLTRV